MPSHAGSPSAVIHSVSRRQFLASAGAAGLSLTRVFPILAQTAPQFDYTIHIAPVAVELAPGKVIKTYGYNGIVPGPACV